MARKWVCWRGCVVRVPTYRIYLKEEIGQETESGERRAEKAGGGGDNLEGICLNEPVELPLLARNPGGNLYTS